MQSSNARREPGRLAGMVLAALSAVALASCGKLSKVGNLPQTTVKASAATVGQPYTTDSSGVMHTTVRSGADVVLTGVNSQTAPSDTNGVPIIVWQWSQVNAGANAVDLIKRTNEASSFTAPKVTQPTTLTFQLTVTNANGVSASTQAQVLVEPVPDGDHFLTFVNGIDHVTVTAITSAVVAKANPGAAAYNATLPFTITVTKLVTYTDNNGNTTPVPVPVGQPVTYSGGWTEALGSGGSNCSSPDPRNPQFQVPIPSLNLDDLLADGSGHRLSDVMQASDIDLDPPNPKIPAAVVYAQVEITSSALPAGVTPGVCVGTGPQAKSSLSDAATPSTLTLDRAALTTIANPTGGPFDTSDSAHAYYATLDQPGVDRSTLKAWLLANGMDMSKPNWGADAHALYTNNFDLGLGRDMYLKANCPAGMPTLAQMTPTQLYQAIGQCDVASVVVNYVGVQAAAQNINQIVAVAMEYSAGPGGGARFTKFYAFAPDQRTGDLQRVTSVDLDHRGQKYLPAACVVCHGGLPGTAAGGVYSQGGNVAAGFLPWDLTSLLYSDTDPGFSQKSEDSALKSQFTEANQLGQFKLLNAGAYLTADDPNRFALLRELLEGWYGGQHGLPGATAGNPNSFNTAFVPAGWSAAANGNPAGSDTFYTNVFAHNCRMCHVMQVPGTIGGVTNNLSNGGLQGSGTMSCRSNVNPTTLEVGEPDQYPIGCYWQFAKLQNLATYLSDARMPFARRTMDRLWVDSSGYPSAAGQQLIATLSQASVNVFPAGTTTVVANPSLISLDTSSAAGFGFMPGGVSGDVTDWIRLTPTDTVVGGLLAQPSWQVCADPGTGPAATESCAGSESEFPLVGAGAVPAQFQIPQSGSYLLELDSAGSKVSTAGLLVPKQAPSVQNLPTIMVPLQPLPIDLTAPGLVSVGNGPESSYTWWVSNLSNLTVTPQGANDCLSQAQACSLSFPVTLTLSPTSAINAGYTVNVADVDAPPSVAFAVASVTVEQLPANPQTGFVCAYDFATSATQTVLGGMGTCPTTTSSTGTLDLSQGFTPPPGYSLQLQLQCALAGSPASSCSGTQWVPGTLTVSGTTLSYSPPTGFATNSKDGSVANSNTVSPNYQLVLVDSSNNVAATSGWVSLTVQVRANVSFDTDVVAGVFQSNTVPQAGANGTCISCHTGSGDGLDFSLASSAIYAELCGAGNGGASCNASTTYPGLSGQFVVTSSPTSSLLLTHPMDLDGFGAGHGGGNRCPSGFSATTPAGIANTATCDLTNVLQWIEDGAYDF